MKTYIFPLILLFASSAFAAPNSYFEGSQLGLELYEHLDLKSFRSSFGPGPEKVRTLKHRVDYSCSESKVILQEVVLVVECSDWYYKVEVVGRDDYDGDGVEDLRLRFEDRARGATYNKLTNVTVSRKSLDGPIVFTGLESEKEIAR